MDAKWKCSMCDTYNQATDTVCFVCGTPKSSSGSGGYTGTDIRTTIPGTEAAAGFFKKVKQKMMDFFKIDTETVTTGPVDIRTSEDSSRGAYVEAGPRETPVRAPVLPAPTTVSTAVPATSVRRESAEAAEPWPEHRIRFCPEKFAAMRCTEIVRSEMGGVHGYEMHMTDGSKRFINLNNLKMLGLAENA